MVLLFFATSAAAKEIPPVPNPPRLVNDFANVLSEQEEQALENKLVSFYDSTSNQITIILDKSLEGEEVADYARKIGEAWGIRGKDRRNGVIIYAAIEDRNLTIQVGYDLEPVITDARTYQIRSRYLNPNFKEGNYYKGLDEATDVLMQLASGEYHDAPEKKTKGLSTSQIIFIVIIIIIILNIIRKSGGGDRRRRGSWGNFTGGMGPFYGGGFGGGGFGGFGGGGGGGFGGFGGGGGGFGGGGSSGKW